MATAYNGVPQLVDPRKLSYYIPTRKDFTLILPEKICTKIFSYLDFNSKVRSERTCERWKRLIEKSYIEEPRPVWLYLIFRRNLQSGHDRVSVKTSREGPLFWNRFVVYVYACACHFNERHEEHVLSLCKKLSNSVQRMCIVDSPVNLPFIMNTFYEFVIDNLVNLQFLYLRELDLENMTAVTVDKMAAHKSLKKVVAHDCINSDALTEFQRLKQAMVFNGPIQGLRALLEGFEALEEEVNKEKVTKDLASVSLKETEVAQQ
jgi:hypothetical protein